MINKLTIPSEEFSPDIYSISGGHLAYRDGIINEGNSIYRNILVIDLYKKLRQREWNHPIIKSISPKGNLAVYPPSKSNEELTTVDPFGMLYYNRLGSLTMISTMQNDVERDSNVSIDYEEIEKGLSENLTKLREFLVENKDIIQEQDNTSASNNSVDFVNGSITFEITRDGQYTNILGLENIVQKCSSSPDSIIKVTVTYSIGKDIYSVDTIFKPISSNLVEAEFIRRLGGDVELEFTNGVLRVMPISDRVAECVISNCIITYGKL